MTQAERVLRHLRRFGGITPMEAMRDYGCMRLGARIYDLKRQGHPIVKETVHGKNRFGEKTHYARYLLIEKAPAPDDAGDERTRENRQAHYKGLE